MQQIKKIRVFGKPIFNFFISFHDIYGKFKKKELNELVEC